MHPQQNGGKALFGLDCALFASGNYVYEDDLIIGGSYDFVNSSSYL